MMLLTVLRMQGTMNKTGPQRFVPISAAVIFSMIISVNIASPSSSRDADKYVYPKLAADGISSDDGDVSG